MRLTSKKQVIDNFFIVKSGNFHATKDLDFGGIPLISCGDTDNGLVGYFDVPKEKRFRHSITVAYNGQPLLAKFHPYEFGAKDDVAVLQPKTPMPDNTLLYIATQLNAIKWRYSYGRKCFREKLRDITIQVPVKILDNGENVIDNLRISNLFPIDFRKHLPPKTGGKILFLPIIQWQSFAITEFFNIKRGDFHSLEILDPGQYRTVSRITTDNGTVGYFSIPGKAKVYPQGRITVSTVGGDAFVQLSKFIATDNVLILIPKIPMTPEILFFISFILNYQKWRYSYGRQCYKSKFEATTKIWLPVTDKDKIDINTITKLLKNTSYFSNINI
jgi:hypothetical protein